MNWLFKLFFYTLLSTVLFVGFYFAFGMVMRPAIREIEQSELNRSLSVMASAFEGRVSQLDVIVRDWSFWDESYQFIGDLNNSFIQTNLLDQTLTNARVNVVLFYDTQANLVYRKAVNRDNGTVTDIPAQLLVQDKTSPLIPKLLALQKSRSVINGVLHTPAGDLIYSAAPILKSNGDGPPRGVLLMGRYFDETDTDSLKKTLGMDFDVFDYYNLDPSVDTALRNSGSFIERPDNRIIGYKLIRDTFNEPALYIRYVFPKVTEPKVQKRIPYLALIPSVITSVLMLSLRRFLPQ